MTARWRMLAASVDIQRNCCNQSQIGGSVYTDMEGKLLARRHAAPSARGPR